MHLLRVLSPAPWLAAAVLLVSFCAGGSASAANANPAPQSLLARLPDPREWQANPLQRAVKDSDPILQDPTFKQMLSAARRNDARAALQALRELTDRFPDKYPVLHNLRGAVALHLKFNAEAERSFRRVTVIAPRTPYGWYNLAWVKIAENRLPDAAGAARQSVNASPSFAPGWLLLAACQNHLGKPADATASATRATREAPNSPQSWIILAQCKLVQGKPDDAVTHLERARSLDSGNALANQLLGACYIQTNKPAKAITPYEQALKTAPTNPAICRQLGYCYLATGRIADAETICRRGVKLSPRYAPAWDMLGLCYRREGKQREALDAFQHAVNAAPRDLNARAHLDEARLAPSPSRG